MTSNKRADNYESLGKSGNSWKAHTRKCCSIFTDLNIKITTNIPNGFTKHELFRGTNAISNFYAGIQGMNPFTNASIAKLLIN